MRRSFLIFSVIFLWALHSLPTISFSEDECSPADLLTGTIEDPLAKWRECHGLDTVEFKNKASDNERALSVGDEYLSRYPKQEKIWKAGIGSFSAEAIKAAFLEAVVPSDIMITIGDEKYYQWQTALDITKPDHKKIWEDEALPLPNRLVRWPQGQPITIALIHRQMRLTQRDVKELKQKQDEFVEIIEALNAQLNSEAGLKFTPVTYSNWEYSEDWDLDYWEWIKEAYKSNIIFYINISEWRDHFSPLRKRRHPEIFVKDRRPTVNINALIRSTDGQEIDFSAKLRVQSDYEIQKSTCNPTQQRVGGFLFSSKVIACAIASLGLPNLYLEAGKDGPEILFVKYLYSGALRQGMPIDQVQQKLEVPLDTK